MKCNLWRATGFAAGLAVLAGLGGCVIEPLDGGGHGRGGEHEDHDRHDRGDEHRHDFGVNQGGQFGFYEPYAINGAMAPARSAVWMPVAANPKNGGLWA